MQEKVSYSIGDTFQGMRVAFEENRPLVLRITLLFAILNALTNLVVLSGPAGFAVSIGFLVLLGAVYSGLITALVCVPGKAEGAGELWQTVKPVLARLVWVALVYAAAVFAGMLALIVPGLIIATIWAVSNQVVVVERLGVFRSLGRSNELIIGNGFRVFGFLLLLVLITLLLSALVLLVTTPFGTSALATLLGAFLGNMVTAPILAIGAASLYNELTGKGVNPEPDPPLDDPADPPVGPPPPAE